MDDNFDDIRYYALISADIEYSNYIKSKESILNLFILEDREYKDKIIKEICKIILEFDGI
jgi:hypothetical protein